ncbi:MAG: hypothetical protein H7Z14_02670 [Anaerolineae bacterium]|nr:hypothetical protein [Phycisphaerae bacterium]
MRRTSLTILVLLILAVSPSLADLVKLAKPVRVELQLKPVDAAPSEKLSGDLLQYDDEILIVKVRTEERMLNWIDLVPANACAVRGKLMDRRKANDWMRLGKFAWAIGAQAEATAALTTAVKMDKSLKVEADLILGTEPGRALKPTTQQSMPENPASTKPESGGTKPIPPESPGASSLPPAQSGKPLDREQVVKYQQATPAEHAAAIEEARALAKRVGDELNVSFTEFQTDHFICFNDWDPREAKFLKDNLEGAYATVTKQFEIPVKENVFVGKLPVFMFARHADFNTFASSIDNFSVGDTVAGYYVTMVDRSGKQSGGHMAMWKPVVSGNNVAEAEKNWAYTLVHEFTHAFVARYRTNQRIPRWLNEGVAEVIANGKFPRSGTRDWARRMALTNGNVESVFDDDQMPGGEMYPVMMTMVQTLIAHDRKAFLRYFDDIKAGVDPEEALKKHFNSDYPGLVKAWKKYLTTTAK